LRFDKVPIDPVKIFIYGVEKIPCAGDEMVVDGEEK